ncbi:MAG: hypothetical protein JJU15_17940 [Pararhodobacter sp.]|nr:hypothetical protein [Pararhodobacter sp.]
MRATITCASLISAIVLGLSGFSAPFPAAAQVASTPTAQATLNATLQLRPAQRSEVEAALRAMPPETLYLTFARIHAAFRVHIGDDDLRVARALIDYALLAESELAVRGLERPQSTESAGEMLRLFDLVL